MRRRQARVVVVVGRHARTAFLCGSDEKPLRRRRSQLAGVSDLVAQAKKDGSFDERAQGYALTMQQGARTLRELGFSAAALLRSGTKGKDSSGGGGAEEEAGKTQEVFSTIE